jgi:hypothetical protein
MTILKQILRWLNPAPVYIDVEPSGLVRTPQGIRNRAYMRSAGRKQ